MSQASPTIGADKTGLEYRTEDNAGKNALVSQHKGSTAPSYAVAGTIWLDDTATPWVLKIFDGTDWIAIGTVNATTNKYEFNESITIDGSADEVQLTVQGHSTQTSNIFVVERSTGDDLLTIDNDSNIVIDTPGTIVRTFDLKSERDTATLTNLRVFGNDSAGNETFYAGIEFVIADNTDASEDGRINLNTNVAGAGGAAQMQLADGVIVGSPTGSFKGAGTINATAVYDDNTLLTCYVMEAAKTGTITDETWDAKVADRKDEDGNITEARSHEDMRKFKARLGTEYDPLDIDKYAQHWKDKGHLTSMPNVENWNPEKGISTGQLLQRLWETVEIQAVHIDKLNQRLKVLEGK